MNVYYLAGQVSLRSAKRFMSTTILERLSDVLSLQGDDRYETHHRARKPSTSTAVLQHYPLRDLPRDTSVGHFTHTDTDSITILFNTDWALQVHSPQRDVWEYIAPHPRHAIVNVGDGSSSCRAAAYARRCTTSCPAFGSAAGRTARATRPSSSCAQTTTRASSTPRAMRTRPRSG